MSTNLDNLADAMVVEFETSSVHSNSNSDSNASASDNESTKSNEEKDHPTKSTTNHPEKLNESKSTTRSASPTVTSKSLRSTFSGTAAPHPASLSRVLSVPTNTISPQSSIHSLSQPNDPLKPLHHLTSVDSKHTIMSLPSHHAHHSNNSTLGKGSGGLNFVENSMIGHAANQELQKYARVRLIPGFLCFQHKHWQGKWPCCSYRKIEPGDIVSYEDVNGSSRRIARTSMDRIAPRRKGRVNRICSNGVTLEIFQDGDADANTSEDRTWSSSTARARKYKRTQTTTIIRLEPSEVMVDEYSSGPAERKHRYVLQANGVARVMKAL